MVFVLASVILVNEALESDAVSCATFAAVACAGVGHLFVRRGRIAFAAQNLKVIMKFDECYDKGSTFRANYF